MLGVKGFSLDLAGIDNVRVADPERGSFKDRQGRKETAGLLLEDPQVCRHCGAPMRFKPVIYREY
jgi:hypothetical protein